MAGGVFLFGGLAMLGGAGKIAYKHIRIRYVNAEPFCIVAYAAAENMSVVGGDHGIHIFMVYGRFVIDITGAQIPIIREGIFRPQRKAVNVFVMFKLVVWSAQIIIINTQLFVRTPKYSHDIGFKSKLL